MPNDNVVLKQDSYFVIDVDNPVIDRHDYYVVGTYDITLNISNFVSWMYFEQSIDLDEPVIDLMAWADPSIINVSAITTVHVNQTWGSRLNITWDWLDPNGPTLNNAVVRILVRAPEAAALLAGRWRISDAHHSHECLRDLEHHAY